MATKWPYIKHSCVFMKVLNYLCILIFLFSFLDCKKKEEIPKMEYNQKANDLIRQLIADNPCNCLMEISNESMIKIFEEEIPILNVRKIIMKDLGIQNEASLDSLDKLSIDFIFDRDILKQNKITIIRNQEFITGRTNKYRELHKHCPKGILCIKKPIFDKYFKTAVIDYGFAFTCIKGPMAVYNFTDGKWVVNKN